MTGELLTQREHDLVALLAEVANKFAEVVGDGPTREGDLTEAVHHIHILQRMVLKQAAARAYPTQYRLLGEVVGVDGAGADGQVQA